MSKDKIIEDFCNKIIEVPDMEYYDDAKTQPKFSVEVYGNGSLYSLVNLDVDGTQHGLGTWWHENGQKWSEVNWVNGKSDGSETYWHENGQKKSEGNWKDDKKHGLYTEWYDNGQKKSEGNWKDNNLDGLYTEWYFNGKKKLERKWVKGKVDSVACWDENGNERKN